MLSSFFFGNYIVTFSFYSIFLIFHVCKVSLFSLNNSIQSIVLVFCYKKYCLICSTFFYRCAVIL